MTSSLRPEEISLDDFEAALNRYQDYVPDKLKELDKARFETIPEQIKSRNLDDDGALLSKEELQQLVDWKLY